MRDTWRSRGGHLALLGMCFGLLVLVASGFRSEGGAWAVALGSMVLFGLAVFLLARSQADETPRPVERDSRFLAAVFVTALILRLGIGLAIHPGGGYASYLGPDEWTFDVNARQFSLWLQNATEVRLSYRWLDSLQVGYFYMIGVVYYMLGHHLLLAVALNCLLGALCIFPAYDISRELLDRRAGRLAALLLAFFPSLVLWSTLVVRDIVVVLALLLIFRTSIRLKRRFSLLRVIQLCALLAALGTLRQYLFLIAGLSVAVTFVIGRTQRLGRSLLVGTLVVLGLVFLVKLVGFGRFELGRASLDAIAQQRRWNALEDSGAAFHTDIDISTPTNALTYLPTGVMWFLFAPFPWQVTGTRQLLATPDVLIWYLLFPVTIYGLGHLVRRRFSDVSVILVFVIALTVLYGLVEGNVGIIFRHRAQVLAPLFCCTGVGISLRRRRKEEARQAVVTRRPARVVSLVAEAER